MTAINPVQATSNHSPVWQQATWEEYVQVRDYHKNSDIPRVKLFFYDGALLVDDAGWESINHATVRGLFVFILSSWLSQVSQERASFLGGALLEKDRQGAGTPDLMVYVGDDFPTQTEGESQKIDLNRWRAPDLVGEISDGTLDSDLGEKKRLYAALGIPEYWVVNALSGQVSFFRLNGAGQHCEVAVSSVLCGLTAALLAEATGKLDRMTNMEAAIWFNQQTRQAK